jgi:cytochrome c oxidase subunit 3
MSDAAPATVLSQPRPRAHVHAHFEDLHQQAHAAKVGMAAFLASEALLFAGLFTAFFAYRTAHPAAFQIGVHANTKTFGSVNTGVLLTSSALVALAVHATRRARRRQAGGLLCGAIALGLAFLVLKFTEYAIHFQEGIYPGGEGRFFTEHPQAGLPQFWTLYYVMTGIHAIHVTVGLSVLAALLGRAVRGNVGTPPDAPLVYPLEIGALYWHLVDLVWIFLWPIFYLGSAR